MNSGISHLFSIMSCEASSITDVGQAGSHLVVLLCRGRVVVDNLNHLHYTTYMHLYTTSLQCFDTVGWASGRASGL